MKKTKRNIQSQAIQAEPGFTRKSIAPLFLRTGILFIIANIIYIVIFTPCSPFNIYTSSCVDADKSAIGVGLALIALSAIIWAGVDTIERTEKNKKDVGNLPVTHPKSIRFIIFWLIGLALYVWFKSR